MLQLFYCTRGECQGYGGWEPFADDLSRVRIVHPPGPGGEPPVPPDPAFPAKRVVGWTPFPDLPDPQEHDEIGLKYTYDFDKGTPARMPRVGFDVTVPIGACPAEGIAATAPGAKLGGWPAWVQGVE